MIRARSLCRRFGDATAVAGFDVAIERGEIFGLVGPDGAGKTTIMRMLAGVLLPSEGEAQVAGCDVVREPERVKERIAYMSQRFGLYPDLSVTENIRFYADLYGVPRADMHSRIEELLAFTGLAPFRRRLAGRLSGGMKQKLGLACALVHQPEVLLLDEPTNGVDPVSRREFWRVLNRLAHDGVTVFVSTAYLDEAERCTRLALLDRGRVLAQGTVQKIRALLPGVTWEIVGVDPRALARHLRAVLPGALVAAYGDRLQLALAGDDERAIRRVLGQGGFAEAAVRPIRPSLETVFLGVLAGVANARREAGEAQA